LALVDCETRRDRTRQHETHAKSADAWLPSTEHSHERLPHSAFCILHSAHEPRATAPQQVQSMISEQMLDSCSTTMTITRQFRRSRSTATTSRSKCKKCSARSLVNSNSNSILFVARFKMHTSHDHTLCKMTSQSMCSELDNSLTRHYSPTSKQRSSIHYLYSTRYSTLRDCF
jgi:hypothetical protein